MMPLQPLMNLAPMTHTYNRNRLVTNNTILWWKYFQTVFCWTPSLLKSFTFEHFKFIKLQFKNWVHSSMVEALCYKLESHEFNSWCHWSSIDLIFLHSGTGIDSVFNRNEYQESSWGYAWLACNLTTSPPSLSWLSRKFVSLNICEPCGPPQPITAIDLPLSYSSITPLFYTVIYFMCTKPSLPLTHKHVWCVFKTDLARKIWHGHVWNFLVADKILFCIGGWKGRGTYTFPNVDTHLIWVYFREWLYALALSSWCSLSLRRLHAIDISLCLSVCINIFTLNWHFQFPAFCLANCLRDNACFCYFTAVWFKCLITINLLLLFTTVPHFPDTCHYYDEEQFVLTWG
jgi:hypothetical protein